MRCAFAFWKFLNDIYKCFPLKTYVLSLNALNVRNTLIGVQCK